MAKPRSSTTPAEILDYNADYKNRVIYFGEVSADANECTEINNKSIQSVILAIHIMAQQAPKTPISLYMNSDGGSLSAAWALIDTMLSCTCQIKFFGYGEIQSSAVMIMAAADERYLMTHTDVMLHDISWNSPSSQSGSHHSSDAESYKKALKCKVKFLADNSNMSKEFYELIFNSGKDLLISAQEAVDIGLADEIIPYTKRGNLRKKRNAKKKPSSRRLTRSCNTLLERIQLPVNIEKVLIHTPAQDEVDPNITIVELEDVELIESNGVKDEHGT